MFLAASTSTLLDNLSQLGPVATGSAAVVALIVGVVTVIQRNRADRRDQWWKRAQWAFDLTLSDDPVKVTRGYEVLTYLTTRRLAGADEQALLAATSDASLESGPELSDNENTTDEEGTDDGSTPAGP